MKKIVKNKEMVKATRKFTDRELPRKVFWDKYEQMKQNIHNLEDIYIISYYGVGGIGKSTLLRKIVEELKEKEEKPYYVLHDFESAQDAKGTLLMLKNKLEETYKFDFPLFDLALYAYAKKIGESAEKPEVQSFMDKSRVLSLLSDGVSEIPIVGLAAKVLKYADSTVAILRSAAKNNKEDLLRIEKETEEETYKNLPYYFSQDLIANIEKLDKPLVILLDTYEKLVNELSDEGYSVMKDMWLRSDNGPILQVPGVLWIIAGREKIKWGEYDKDWDETLEQHILGDLSFNDANEFLEEAGIIEPELRKQIYELTNGTPVYLDICVDTYELLQNRGEDITINKFGINIEELVERYIRYMDTQTSEMVYMLSNIDNWNDKMIQEIGAKILPNFSIVLYNKIKELSFVLEDNNNFYMHKTVKNIFQKECPDMIKNKALEVLFEYYYDTVDKMSGIDKEYESMLDRFLENAERYLASLTTEEDLNDDLFNTTYILHSITDHGTRELFIEKAEKMYQKLTAQYHDKKSTYHVEMLKVCILFQLGNFYEARMLLDKLIEKMIEQNDYSQVIICHQEVLSIYISYPNYHQIKKLIQWLEKCNIQKNIVSHLLVSLNTIIGNVNYAVEKIEELLQGQTKSTKNRMVSIGQLLYIFQNDANNTYIEKYKKYVLELEKLLEKAEISEANKYNTYIEIERYYREKEGNYEKAYQYINKAETILEENMKQFSYMEIENLLKAKTNTLKELKKQQELEEFCTKFYEKVINELDIHDIGVYEMRILLLHYLNRIEEKEQIYNELNEKELSIEEMYKIANIADKLADNKQSLNFISKAIEKIEQEEISAQNIAIFRKVVLELLPYIELENAAKIKYMDELCDYYEKNCLEDYEEIEDTFLTISTISRFIGEIKQGRIYLERLKKIAIEKFGEKSVEIATIDNQIGNTLSEENLNQEAIEYYESAYQIYKEIYGEDHIETITTCTNKISTYVEIDYTSGIKMLEEYYEKQSQKNIPESSKYHILTYLIKLKRKYNYPVNEVLPQLKELLEYYSKQTGSGSKILANLIDFLASTYSDDEDKASQAIDLEYKKELKKLLITLFGEENESVKKVEESLATTEENKK